MDIDAKLSRSSFRVILKKYATVSRIHHLTLRVSTSQRFWEVGRGLVLCHAVATFFVAFSYGPQLLMTVEFVITKQKILVALWGSSLLPSKAGEGGWLVGPLSVTSTPPRTCHGNPGTHCWESRWPGHRAPAHRASPSLLWASGSSSLK